MTLEKARRYHFTGFDSYWRDTIFSKFSQRTDRTVDATQAALTIKNLEVLKISE